MRECPECGRLYPDEEAACPHDGRALESPDDSDAHLGRTVGSYVLIEKLGSGGMGDVYLGEHPEIGSHVAIKILNERFAGDSVIVERFFNEARAANLIGHENIVQIFDFGRLPEGPPYFVMEWLQGDPLSARAGSPFTLEAVTPLLLQITTALQAAHEAGIVHRDLKPDNIFLVSRLQGVQVKLLDFGIAKLSGSAPKLGTTQSGVVMGTARYLSPEQAAGDAAHVSAASDIYSLGVILYQLVTGQLPFDRPTYAETLTAHLRESPRPPRELVPEIPAAFETIILRCLEKRPEDRFSSMRELEQAMQALRAPPLSPKPSRTWRRRLLPAGLVLIPAVGLIGWVLWPAPAPPSPTPQEISATPSPPPTPSASPAPEPDPSPQPSPTPEIASAQKEEKKPAPQEERKPASKKRRTKAYGNHAIPVDF